MPQFGGCHDPLQMGLQSAKNVAVEAHLRVALAQYLNHCDPASIVEEAALIRKFVSKINSVGAFSVRSVVRSGPSRAAKELAGQRKNTGN
jgi:hypothetical protein